MKKKKHKNFKVKHTMSLGNILGYMLLLFHCFCSHLPSVHSHALHSDPSVINDKLLVGVWFHKILESK